MHRLLVAVVILSSILGASAAWACGAPLQTSPGFAGTALAEGPNQISVFTASASGYSWDRLQGPSWTRTHVADITGTLVGNIESDARVDRAIASQSGEVIEVGAAGRVDISTASQAQTTVFGAALDAELNWQVLAYSPDATQLTLFSETAPGTFALVSSIVADCGNPEMLDLVDEPGDTLVGLCSGQAVVVVDGQLQLTALPTPAIGLGRASDGTAVFYGKAANGTDLVRLGRSAPSWAVDSTISTGGVIPEWLIPVSETSVLVKSASGFGAFTLVDGTWQSSTMLDGSTPVTSAFGAPAQVLGGQYELTLYSSVQGVWQPQDLGPMGSPPTYQAGSGGFGCQSVDGVLFMPLFVLALFFMQRARRQLIN